MYLATLGRYLAGVSLRAFPNPLSVARSIDLHSSSPSEHHLLFCSKPSQPTVAKSIQHYRNYTNAAMFQKSARNLQPLSDSAGVHHSAISHCSVSGYWTDSSSPESQLTIHSSTCPMYQSLAAKGFWEIDSKRILCASS
jgi:hypothetical protein